MLNTALVFESTPKAMEVLLESFFGMQPDKHVQDWRWHCYSTGNYHYWPKYSNRIVYGSRELS
jgi:hypothetical protein